MPPTNEGDHMLIESQHECAGAGLDYDASLDDIEEYCATTVDKRQ